MRNKKIIFIIVFLGLSVIALFRFQLKNFFLDLSQDIHLLFKTLGNSIANSFKFLFRAKNVLKDNEYLKQENQNLIGEIVSLGELKKENSILREALDLEAEQGLKVLPAKVVFCQKNENYLVINKGEKHGLIKGMPIIISQNILVGVVDKVYDDFADVVLLTKKGSSFPVHVQETDIMVRARGDGGAKLFLDLLPREQEVKQNDLVITTSIDGTFPSGLLVGKIESVRNSDLESYQTAILYFTFDIERIEDVFVILDY